MSNGFDMCEQHFYHFATEVKDCPYCRITELEAEVESMKDEIKALNTQIDIEVCSNIVQSQRAEDAEAKLSRYEQAVSVEINVDSYDYGDTAFICEDIALPKEFRGQRVRVLVTAIEPIAVPDHIVDVNKMVEEEG